MVRKFGPVCPEDPNSTTVMPTIEPLVSVKSVNGNNGDVVITAESLGLKNAVLFKGTVATTEAVIALMTAATTNDLYFCTEDTKIYLADGAGSYHSWTAAN